VVGRASPVRGPWYGGWQIGRPLRPHKRRRNDDGGESDDSGLRLCHAECAWGEGCAPCGSGRGIWRSDIFIIHLSLHHRVFLIQLTVLSFATSSESPVPPTLSLSPALLH
jgi:hypothetical protein